MLNLWAPAWISYLNIALLLGMLAITLFNATSDPISTRFAYTYAAISIVVLVSTNAFGTFVGSSLVAGRYTATCYTNVGLR